MTIFNDVEQEKILEFAKSIINRQAIENELKDIKKTPQEAECLIEVFYEQHENKMSEDLSEIFNESIDLILQEEIQKLEVT